MRIVCIGGGTGLPVLLRGLRQLSEASPWSEPAIVPIAMVCVSDNGGSSGRLRSAFDIPAVGDLRNCLVALARDNNKLAELFQCRLPGEGQLGGHAVGNLVLAALSCRTGSLREAVGDAGELVQSAGRVLPSTDSCAPLCARFDDGTVVRGETEIAHRRQHIQRVWLEPPNPRPTPELLREIRTADVIVLGPGSLFTSIVPNLLVRGVPAAIRDSGAVTVLVSNLMTQPGESEGYSAADHLSAVEDYLGAGTIRFCVLNSGPIQDFCLAKYRHGNSRPVEADLVSIAGRGTVPVTADLLDSSSPEVRHDPLKLARVIAALGKGTRVPGPAMTRSVIDQITAIGAAS